MRWKDIYGWFLESLISPVDELEEGTEPCLALLEVIELYKGRHQSNHSSPILLSNGREEVNLINSFSRADVVLHIFVHNNTTSTSRLK